MNMADFLLDWYDRNRRSLPWRGSRDPYVIWVSEIIFQQTRIEQGTGYYLRFIERFPTLLSLAQADEDEVLHVWQGLGYYSRARNMLFTARAIQENHAGIFPEDFDSILKLKGIGDYTASCIASICFGKVHAAVDGNVYRVISRLYADATLIDSPAGKLRFKNIAQELISTERPGDFNEALMDLGATVCKPRSPDCINCPLSGICQAKKAGTQLEFPVKSQASKRSGHVINYLLLLQDDHLIIRKRQGRGIWQGLYELPAVEGEADVENLAQECKVNYGMDVSEFAEMRRVKHALTHADLDIRFYSSNVKAGSVPPGGNSLSVPFDDWVKYPFPKPLADFLKSLSET